MDIPGVVARLSKQLVFSQAALDEQVLKDSNYFCPLQEGTLQASGVLSTKLGSGIVIWDTPYAHRLYWHPEYNFSLDRNPNARGKWFEEAKARHLPEWLAKAQGALNA
jgi:hypothetical protein